MQAILRGAAGLIAGLALFSSSTESGTIIVHPPQGITAAVQASSPGDTILVSPGTYGPEWGAPISHSLTVIGIGGEEMNEIGVCYDLCSSYLFQVNPGVQDVIVEGLTLTKWNGEPNFFGARGILALQGAEVLIQECTFRDLGTGVETLGSTLMIRNCLVEGNVNNFHIAVRMRGGSGLIEGNTFASTIDGLWLSEEARPHVARNIFAHNAGRAVTCLTGSVPTFECNDAWSNAIYSYGGCPDPTGSNGNISADPLFCDLPGRDFRLRLGSPCLPQNSPPGCGLIGAFGACDLIVSVDDTEAPGPHFQLFAEPNPFSGTLELRLDGPNGQFVDIYDIEGQLVERLTLQANRASWTPNRSVPRGTYFARVHSGETAVVKIVLIR